MSVAKIQTESGYALPPAPRHSITVHSPGWENALKFMNKDIEFIMSVKSMYPRMLLHRDIQELTQKILAFAKAEGQNALFFVTKRAADACVIYATAAKRGDDILSAEEIAVRIFDIDVRLYGVFFPAQKTPVLMPFWSHPGVGISSRLAEESLKHLDLLHEVVSDDSPAPKLADSPAHAVLRERIAGLLERATADPPRKDKVKPDDVYLFQTGMASIWLPHQYLLSKFNGTTVLFGFAFHSTIHVFEDYGPGAKLLGLGTEEELDQLETHLKAELKEGRKVQAVWCEFPSNPLLVTPNLGRLRSLADNYGFALIVDDTIGSFCNVDVMGAADIVVTSLTKSFSGYADVMGASAVLNPSSSRYPELKALFKESYSNNLYNGDAEVLEKNSRDYMQRSATINNNTLRIAEWLQSKAQSPGSSISRVYHPSISSSKANYESRMRKKTPDFTPGYGCLLSVEFENVEATIAFYDNLNVHHGPHLGAHLTLAMPYAKVLYGQDDLEWAGKYGLKETQIRIAPGLEETELLIEDFKIAVRAADEVKEKRAKAAAPIKS
ncbi:O-succinylhomoserine (thiol)-lyase [Hyphodiscus hymeniophilus]|uniref:O-succinylhomoserine (Thiol)-lyase n=1 Tax=Hyphodiscus hymeniophilus TaxID=353542 RepID=A0A9P6VHK3_9HELO|nr:O-succinylhomoserine (thiol)-lyase [Hyphodiscus hymeniophilus]